MDFPTEIGHFHPFIPVLNHQRNLLWLQPRVSRIYIETCLLSSCIKWDAKGGR